MTRAAPPRAGAVVACLAVAAWSWAITGADARAEDDENRPERPVLDLIAQTAATADAPAVVHLGFADAGLAAGAALRVRLYEPATTRARLWASTSGPPSTAETSSWTLDELELGRVEDGTARVAVPIPLPEEAGAGRAEASVPRPLHLELIGPDDAVIDTLRTFLVPPVGAEAPGSAERLAVAVVVDLRMPPARRADGGAHIAPESLERVVGLASVLTARAALPVTVDMSAETLDALNLVGDDSSAAVLRAALGGAQLLASPWTGLDIDDWAEAGREDVVLDGLSRSRETFRVLDLAPSTVMHFNGTPSPAAAALVGDSPAAVAGYLADRVLDTTTASMPLSPVAALADAEGRVRPMAQADPLLEVFLRNDDPELGAQWATAELSRMAATPGEPESAVVVASALATDWSGGADGGPPTASQSPATEPEALALLLDRLGGHPMIELVTLDDLLARSVPRRASVLCCAAGTPADPDGFGLYLARRAVVESRLVAYRSFVGPGSRGSAADPLGTLLAASASPFLAAAERMELLDAVDRQATQRVAGVELVDRGRITITESSAALPVTVSSSRAAPVTVALVLEADGVGFPEGGRRILTLQPGRNDLSIPISVTGSGTKQIDAAITTPDGPGAVTLSAGTLTVRRADVSGLGLVVSLGAVLALAAWWLRVSGRGTRTSTRTRRADGATRITRTSRADGATVATHGSDGDPQR